MNGDEDGEDASIQDITAFKEVLHILWDTTDSQKRLTEINGIQAPPF